MSRNIPVASHQKPVWKQMLVITNWRGKRGSTLRSRSSMPCHALQKRHQCHVLADYRCFCLPIYGSENGAYSMAKAATFHLIPAKASWRSSRPTWWSGPSSLQAAFATRPKCAAKLSDLSDDRKPAKRLVQRAISNLAWKYLNKAPGRHFLIPLALPPSAAHAGTALPRRSAAAAMTPRTPMMMESSRQQTSCE
jgi:hypothetical protein